MRHSLSAAVEQLLPRVGQVVDVGPVGGGCISEAKRVSVRSHDGSATTTLFVKRNDASFLENFQCEWDGLERLSHGDVIGVPRPLAVGPVGDSAWLISEWIEEGSRGGDFYSRFGHDLAQLHRHTLGQRIGLERDNYLGSARQVNSSCDRWPEFVARHRLGFQIRWASQQGVADAGLRADCQRIVDNIDQLLEGRAEQTSLLHGDLWSGNYLCGRDGRPVIIDPAVYYGCREAELGMLRLFGGCEEGFYHAYHDGFPLPDGWQRRVNVYVLYHLLNHLNLFGSGYLGQCRTMAAKILRA